MSISKQIKNDQACADLYHNLRLLKRDYLLLGPSAKTIDVLLQAKKHFLIRMKYLWELITFLKNPQSFDPKSKSSSIENKFFYKKDIFYKIKNIKK